MNFILNNTVYGICTFINQKLSSSQLYWYNHNQICQMQLFHSIWTISVRYSINKINKSNIYADDYFCIYKVSQIQIAKSPFNPFSSPCFLFHSRIPSAKPKSMKWRNLERSFQNAHDCVHIVAVNAIHPHG